MYSNYNSSTWAALGFLRFILASIVFVYHLHVFTQLPPVLIWIATLGSKSAVLGFLTISGFCIGYSYNNNTSGYVTRRFLRIYPLYVTALLLTILTQFLLGSPFHLPGQEMVTAGTLTSISNFFFLQGFLSITITYNGPLWSLAIEVFYYMLVPFLNRVKTQYLILIIVCSIAVYYYFFEKNWIWGFTAVKFAWAWLLGFYFGTRKININFSMAFILIAVICVYFVVSARYDAEPFGHLTYLVVAMFILAQPYISFQIPGLLIKLFDKLGNLSYPLYLFHMPLYLLFYKYMEIRSVWYFLALLILCTIPINYIFNDVLKEVIWRPVADFIGSKKYIFTLNNRIYGKRDIPGS